MANARPLLLISCLLALAACPSPKYPACDGDKDCKNGEKCLNHQCAQCATNADCPTGNQCTLGKCLKQKGWCAGNDDCDNGMVCRLNSCVFCENDAECGAGGKCKGGRCLKPGNCINDQDCPEDQDCVENKCKKPGVSGLPPPSCQLGTVYFGFDQYSLNDEGKRITQQNFDCLQKNQRRTVRVVGNTDPRGSVEYNISLSDDRAQAVVTYLSRLGVDPARMRKVPKGAAEAKGFDEPSWSKDRRVEIVWE
jgi:peptidoglycan-associated lipoprotein